MHKYLYTAENGDTVSYENFANILKSDMPDNITNTVSQIFETLQEGNGTVSTETLKKNLRLDNHPRVKLMLKNKETLLREMEFSILFLNSFNF